MMSRRQFARRTLCVGAGVVGGGILTTGYGFWEASDVQIRRQSVALPALPEVYVGKTVAVVADLHHGPYVGIDFIRSVVQLTNSLNPDLIALVGDYAHKGYQAHEQLPPCLAELAELRAPLGVFAIPGNHDMAGGGRLYRETIATTPLIDLTNSQHRIVQDGQALWLAGVDDLWWGKPNLDTALKNVPLNDTVILLSHNPDFAEDRPDRRVGLILSGHTHGGQVYLPGYGTPWLPSKYGDKYRHGLVDGPASKVFISRGLGEAGVPIRLGVPPEICLLTLSRKSLMT